MKLVAKQMFPNLTSKVFQLNCSSPQWASKLPQVRASWLFTKVSLDQQGFQTSLFRFSVGFKVIK